MNILTKATVLVPNRNWQAINVRTPQVTAGDIAPRMLENAQKLCAKAGFRIETRLFPAEEMPFADGSFDLVTVRVAPHHFSSPQKLVQEAARVLRPGGHFLLIDGTVPDDDPETQVVFASGGPYNRPAIPARCHHGRAGERKTPDSPKKS